MVKAYLRYEQARSFGVVASPDCAPVYDAGGKNLVCAALERLAVWDVRRGILASSLVPPPRESGALPAVTRIARAPGSDVVAAGASDGSIRLWNLVDGSTDVLLKGHKSEVTALRFSRDGSLLVSGGKDTNVVVWDVVAEAGLCRLRGHKGQVTDACFVDGDNNADTRGASASGRRLVTCSKDATVRVWDLDTQHCAQTVSALGAEAWSLDVDARGARLAVGTSDDRLHLFAVAGGKSTPTPKGSDSDENTDLVAAETETETATANRNEPKAPLTREQIASSIEDASRTLTPMGHLPRADKSRASLVRFDDDGELLGVQTVGRAVEMYRVRNDAEMAKRRKRKAKRKREKGRDGGGGDDDANENENVAADELELAAVVRTKAKTRGFAFAPRSRRGRPGVRAVVAVLLDNNAVEEWELEAADDAAANDAATASASKFAEPTRSRALEAAGHRSDIRAVALSSDDATLVSCSAKGAKVWDPSRGACLRSVDGGYGLCVAFAPAGRHVVVGTKSGALELVDVQAGARLRGAPDAHEGAVWGVSTLPDGSGFVSCSADKTVKFWEWRLVDVDDDDDGETGGDGDGVAPGAGPGRRELGVAHVRTLQMSEDVLSVRVTKDGKLLSVSLLDNTLKVFFVDTLKFFLSLYGHRLPALCHDVSDDGALLASGGADKNIRIWGMDFGDCHKSVFAHGDSVTAIAFVPKTHYMFSTGKDRAVKYWDADKFEPLLTLQGHHGEAWCVAVSARGDFCVTAGHDRAIRVWERTDEPFFVDEEKERRLESLLEEGGGNGADDDDHVDRVAAAAGERAAARGASAPAGAEAGMAGRKTLETLSAADAIVDALDVAGHERERIDAEVRRRKRADDGDDDEDDGEDDGDEADEIEGGGGDFPSFEPEDFSDDDELRAANAETFGEERDDGDAVADAVVLGNANALGLKGTDVYPPGLMPNPLLMGQTPERYALAAIEKVRAADLEQAILALPFSSALALLDYLAGWLHAGENIELTCRLAALIVRLHYVQLGATSAARGVLLKVRPLLRKRAEEIRDVFGFNLAGLGMLEAHLKEGAEGDDGGGDDEDDEDVKGVWKNNDVLDDEDVGREAKKESGGEKKKKKRSSAKRAADED
jgi:U3 small nucleolar RNA-associated protein 12